MVFFKIFGARMITTHFHYQSSVHGHEFFKTTHFIFNVPRKMNRTRSVSIEQVFKHVSNESNNVNFYQKIVGSVFLDSLASDHKQNVSCNGTSWIKASVYFIHYF
jgi:hypothetical protein